jgi:hypothetical protein
VTVAARTATPYPAVMAMAADEVLLVFHELARQTSPGMN